MLAGIGNLTLSQLTDASGGTVTISGGTAGAGFSLGVSGGNTSGQTGATGTRVVLAGGNGVTLSQATDLNGGSITIAGITQSVQTQDRFDLSLDGNTAGAPQLISSGTMTLAGGSNITLSQNGNAVSIIGEAAAAGTQTFVGGVAGSNTTYTSGTITITGVGGGVTVSSNTGQRIDISVAAPVAQTGTQFSAGISGGNTSGASGTVGGRIIFAGGNNITLSGSTNGASESITISAASQTVQTQNLHNVTLSGNTAGALAAISSGTLTLAGGNNITLSQAGNAVTISGANAGGAQTGISGIAGSNTTYTSGTVTFTGVGGGITVSSNTGQRIDLSVAAQSNQTIGAYALGNTTGQSSSTTFDARTISVRGDGIVSVGYSGGSLRISASQSVQPETQTAISGIANSQTTYTSGTVSLSELGAITIRSTTGNQFQLSVNAQSVQPETQTFLAGLAASNTTYTSGTMTITGVGGGVTVSSNTGQRIDISVAAPVAQTNQAGSVFAVGNTTSSTSGTYDARTLSLRGDGIISIAATNSGFRISATQSAQTQNLHNVTLSGNTSGVMAQISSGTMTLAGGNNITLSQAGNAVTISGANVGGAQTGISSIAASNTTYTSGQVEFTGSGIVTVRSSAGQRVVIDASQSVDTLGMYALGNTTGQSSSTTFDARTVSLRGDGIVSLGYSNGSLRISASQSVQPETQTFIGGISASDTLYTSGTVRFTGVGGGVTVSSNTGQRVDISVAAQTVQTQNMVAVTLSGNTSGVQALMSSGTLTLAGGNNITVSQNGNAVTISGANVGGAQTGISGIANSQTTYTSGTVSLSELGAITIRSTTGNQFQLSVNPQSVQPETQTFVGGLANSQTTYTSGTISLSELGAITIRSTTGNQFQLSVNSQSVQTQSLFSAGVSTGGNTAGDTGITGTRMVFVGSNNITLSQATAAAGGTITISGPTTAAQTNQAGSVYAVGNTTSSSSGTYDARTLSIRGDGIISVAATNSGWRISASQSVQAETQTFVGGIANSQTTYTSGTVSLSELGAITIRSTTGNQFQLSVNAQSTQPGVQHLVVSNTTFSSGTVSISGFGDVTVNTAANIIRVSAPVQTAQTGISGIANSQTTYTSGTVSLSELGAITIRSTTGNQYQLSVNSQTVQTQNLHNVTLSGNTAGAMAQISSGTMTLAGGNNITLSQAGNAVTISGGGGANFSAGVSNIGNSAGATGITGTRLVLAGGNNITLSQTTDANGGTVTVSAFAQTNQSLGMYAVQNTTAQSSSTTMDARTLSIAGDGGVSVGYSAGSLRVSAPPVSVISAVAPLSTTTAGSTISILGPAQFSGGFSTQGNTAGDTGFVTGRVAFVGSNNITLSGSTNAGSQTISIIGGAGGAGFSAGVSNVGNTLGDTGVSGTRMVLAGIGEVTLSQSTNANGNTISISSPVQTNQSGGAYAVGNTYSSSSGTFDARTISIRGDGIISVAATNSGWRISASQSVQAETQTFVGGLAASNTTYTSGTITITGVGGGVTVSSNTGQRVDISVAAQSVQPGVQHLVVSNTTFSSGTVSISGFGDVTVNTAANIIRVSAPVQTAQTGISGIANSQTTYTSGTVSWSELGAVTIRSTTGNQYQISVNSQTVQTQNLHNVTLSGNTAGAMAHISSGTMTLAGGNNITLSQAGNAVTISGGAGGGFSAGVSTGGNTQGQTGVTGTRLVIVGTNNITLSQATDANGGTISISGQSPAGGAFSGGVSTGGNTAGATGISGTQMVLVGSGVMSLSQTTGANGNTVSILAPATSVLSAVSPLSTSTNGSTMSILGPATSSLVGVSGVSISTNGSTISLFETSGGLFVQELNPYLYAAQTTGAQGQGTLHIQPMQVHPDLRMDRVLIPMWISNASNSSGSITITNIVGIYSRNVNTLSLITSVSTSTNFSGSGTVGSYSLYGGRRWQSIPLTTTLSEGDYYIGIAHRSTTGGAAGHTVAQILMTQQSNATFSGWSGILGAATNATMQHVLGMGVFTSSTLSAPATIPFTSIIGSGTNAMMPPIYALRSGTV